MTRDKIIATPPVDLVGLVRLSHHRWTIPLVAVLGRDRGARFAALLSELGVARPTLERALAAAGRLDLVMANPGYGHPLRPEYLLTPFGEGIAPACRDVLAVTQRMRITELAWRKWSLPVLAALHPGPSGFADLQTMLGGVTPRALTLALDDLARAGWVGRELRAGRTPRPRYRVRGVADSLAAAAFALGAACR